MDILLCCRLFVLWIVGAVDYLCWGFLDLLIISAEDFLMVWIVGVVK